MFLGDDLLTPLGSRFYTSYSSVSVCLSLRRSTVPPTQSSLVVGTHSRKSSDQLQSKCLFIYSVLNLSLLSLLKTKGSSLLLPYYDPRNFWHIGGPRDL